jgi:hypothetical protein
MSISSGQSEELRHSHTPEEIEHLYEWVSTALRRMIANRHGVDDAAAVAVIDTAFLSYLGTYPTPPDAKVCLAVAICRLAEERFGRRDVDRDITQTRRVLNLRDNLHELELAITVQAAHRLVKASYAKFRADG